MKTSANAAELAAEAPEEVESVVDVNSVVPSAAALV